MVVNISDRTCSLNVCLIQEEGLGLGLISDTVYSMFFFWRKALTVTSTWKKIF